MPCRFYMYMHNIRRHITKCLMERQINAYIIHITQSPRSFPDSEYHEWNTFMTLCICALVNSVGSLWWMMVIIAHQTSHIFWRTCVDTVFCKSTNPFVGSVAWSGQTESYEFNIEFFDSIGLLFSYKNNTCIPSHIEITLR